MITIATSALGKRIYAGRLNKAKTAFISKEDVTSDVLKAVIDKIGVGNIESISVDGVVKYEIEIREVK